MALRSHNPVSKARKLSMLFNFQGTIHFSKPEGLVVGSSGLEPPTSRLSGVRSNHLSYEPMFLEIRLSVTFPQRNVGGDEEDRTPDPLLAKQVLSQLSYTPNFRYLQN